MKTIADIHLLHVQFETQFGYKIVGHDQLSDPWFKCKLGVVSSSNIAKVVAKKDSQTRYTFMAELVAQVLTGLQKDPKAIAMDWGNQYEDAARAYYEAKADVTFTKLPFVFMDENFREGSSPDGFVNDKRGAEIKCPFDSTNFVKFLDSDEIDPDWIKQVQHAMRVCDAEQWDFGQYDPRSFGKMLKFMTIERDNKFQATMADAIPQFLHDMDKMLDNVGVKFGDQWTRLKDTPAAAAE